ncbi:carbohydrate sulfotransferase 11 isoform X3 [Hermetia illucens]|uniref:carbohydrate sulfotransferase 11 isoform X3 n=1 Tax=Hermetia illucens TaxID=343691 RepID=UPI0018CC025A|nr:carbohydrate sulfotransferase 11 isoform X3 [Hermetia illucens]
MRSKGMPCRAARRCFLVFTAIALLPLALVYLVTNEQAYKLKGYEAYSKQTLVEKSFRYPLMILGPLKALAKRAVGKSGRSSSYRHYKRRHKYFDNDTTLPTLPDDIVRTMPPSKLELVEQRMKARQKLLAQKCSQLGLDIPGNDSIHKPNSWEFLVNHKYHLIWCNVFKSASSSWMYNFNVLAGYSPEFLKKTTDIPLALARKKYPRVSLDELQEAQNDSITFMIARHPFERLLSAYRDKFIFALPHSFHDKLGSKIVRTYRKNKAERHKPKYPTFSEFVSWLLHEVRKSNHIDMHLVPATKFCTPCLIKFDVIAKFETLEEDQMYLIEKAGLSNVIMPEWRNTGKGKKTQELLQTFYSQLTRKQLDGLYNYYRYDFEVFGYSAISYFNIVRTEENADPDTS